MDKRVGFGADRLLFCRSLTAELRSVVQYVRLTKHML
jgi:hypothetical protein